jgi:hypothetical protein
MPVAESQLAAIWVAGPNRQAIADAADEIDYLLQHDPHLRGESRAGSQRILIQEPLAILFEVHPMTSKCRFKLFGAGVREIFNQEPFDFRTR